MPASLQQALFLRAQDRFRLRPEGRIGSVVVRVGMAVEAGGEPEIRGKGLRVRIDPADAFAVRLGPERRARAVVDAVIVDPDPKALHGNLPGVRILILHGRARLAARARKAARAATCRSSGGTTFRARRKAFTRAMQPAWRSR